jgi:hypothetical protein
MNTNQNSKVPFTTIELKILAEDQYRKDNGTQIVSLEQSEVSNVNSIDVVILRDPNSKIIRHYQHNGDGTFFKLGNDANDNA